MGFDIKELPRAFHVFENEISLPLHTLLKEKEVDYVLGVLEQELLTLDH